MPVDGRVLRPLAIGLLLLVAPAVLAAHPEAYGSVAGVTYYFAYGELDSGHFEATTDSGHVVFDAVMCGFAQLRPDKGNGRVQVQGLIADRTRFQFDSAELLSPDGVTPAIVTNTTVGPSLGQSPPLQASAAAFGEFTLQVGRNNYPDPVAGPPPDNLPEDAPHPPGLQGDFWVTVDGDRDATGAKLAQPERDTEMHLYVRSHPDAVPVTESGPLGPTSGDLPEGWFSPNEAYSARFLFANSKFGGIGTLTVTAEALAAPGQNDLTVAVYTPSGIPLGEANVQPALLMDDTATVSFPLDEFGTYVVEARGSVSMLRYGMQLDLAPPQRFDVHLWWENVTFGRLAPKQLELCREAMGDASVPASVVGRPGPPDWLMEVILVSIAGTIVGILLGVKIVMETSHLVTLKKRFGR